MLRHGGHVLLPDVVVVSASLAINRA